MAGVRVGLDRPRPRRRGGPSIGLIIGIIVGMVVLFVLGFCIALILQGRTITPPTIEAAASSAPTTGPPLPCATTMVTPAEVLPQAEKVRVNVYNATKRKGLAAETALALKLSGFKILGVSNVPDGRRLDNFAELRHGPKGKKAAELLRFYMPDAILVQDTRGGKDVDVVLGREFTVIADDAEVAASMASPSPSTSGPGCALGDPSADAATAVAPAPSLTPPASPMVEVPAASGAATPASS